MQLEDTLISMKVFKTDIFPFRFCIAELKEHKDIKATFVDLDGDEIMFSKDMAGLVVQAKYKDSGKMCSLIVVNKDVANVGTVAHEANHSAENLLENIGIYHCSQTSEVYSYVIGFIAQKIYEAIWE